MSGVVRRRVGRSLVFLLERSVSQEMVPPLAFETFLFLLSPFPLSGLDSPPSSSSLGGGGPERHGSRGTYPPFSAFSSRYFSSSSSSPPAGEGERKIHFTDWRRKEEEDLKRADRISRLLFVGKNNSSSRQTCECLVHYWASCERSTVRTSRRSYLLTRTLAG